MPRRDLVDRSARTRKRIVDAMLRERATLARVQSPPGAGKTRLTREVIAAALEAQATCLVAVQTNAQAIDLVTSMAAQLRDARSRRKFGYWPSADAKEEYAADIGALRSHRNVQLCESTAEANTGPDVVVAVARKWSWHATQGLPAQRLARSFDLGVVDEAYQMRAGELVRFGERIDRLLMVGDPGQLEPFTTVETARWAGLDASVLTPAPDAVAALHGEDGIRAFALPASFRLDDRSASMVQTCFYPSLPFEAVAVAGDRELVLKSVRARDALDATLEHAVRSGWALLELPPLITVRDDPEVAEAVVRLARRLVDRALRVRAEHPASQRRGAPLANAGIAIAVAHRDQRARVQKLVRADAALAGIVVDTANRLQGREFDVVIGWHPLSGRVDASAFHLDTGRLCVMTSRHRQCCILVGRAGLASLLDEHLPPGTRPRGAAADREHDGWIAHRRLLSRLEDVTVPQR